MICYKLEWKTKLKGNKTKRFKDKNKKLKEEGPNKKYQKTKKTNQQFSREDREKKRKKRIRWRLTTHSLITHATPAERERNDTFNYMVDGQV